MALFEDTADFASLAPVLATAQWPLLLPSIDIVERQYLRDQVLGKPLYDQLQDAYTASIASTPVPLNPAMKALLARCRRTVAGLASNKAIPKLGVLFTTGGPMQSQTDTMRPASQWKTKAVADALFEEGISYLDQLIDFLLENGQAYTWTEGSSTVSWMDGEFAKRVGSCLVRTVDEMTAYHVDIGSSGWLMHRLRATMIHVQDRIRGLIGDSAYDDLLSAVQTGIFQPTEAAIIQHARPAVIHLAIAQMATINSITIDSNGAWQWQSTSGSTSSAGPVPASDQRLGRVIDLYIKRGNEHLKALERKAKDLAQAGQYPAYANSSAYAAPFVRASTTPPESSTFSSI